MMTLKQGEDINKQFVNLNDSIKRVNEKFNLYMLENGKRFQKVYNDYNFELNNHKVVRLEADKSKMEINRLNLLLENNEKEHFREKRGWATWMMVSFFLTVFIAANR
jgi:hypothetical protein